MFCFLRGFFFFSSIIQSASLIDRPQNVISVPDIWSVLAWGIRGLFFSVPIYYFFSFMMSRAWDQRLPTSLYYHSEVWRRACVVFFFFFFIITLVFYDGSHRIQKTKWQYARFCPLTCGYIRFGSPHLLHSCIECTREWWWRRDGGHEWQYCSHRRWQPQS